MNVNDVVAPPFPHNPLDQSTELLKRQSELESKYWEIEGRYSPTVNINDRRGQVLIKDFLWRITEEIGEALEAKNNGESRDKVYEELADGLHFVLGLCVITGMTQEFHDAWENQYITPAATELEDLIMNMGCLGNTLKMKPWKQTDVLTDVKTFSFLLKLFVMRYIGYCKELDLSIDNLWRYYYRKSEVNLFRIRSKY